VSGIRWIVPRFRQVPSLSLVALALLAACYAGGPFVTLWRIGRALEAGDVAVLQGAIDWNAVRQGLKDDITEGLIGLPPQALASGTALPPFGAGFASALAATAVDRDVTPEALLRVAGARNPAGAAPFAAIVGARFTSPLEFELRLRLPGQDAGEPPLHLRLALRAGGWRLVRVWIPQDLMDLAAARA
jgi:hypothetical protein